MIKPRDDPDSTDVCLYDTDANNWVTNEGEKVCVKTKAGPRDHISFEQVDDTHWIMFNDGGRFDYMGATLFKVEGKSLEAIEDQFIQGVSEHAATQSGDDDEDQMECQDEGQVDAAKHQIAKIHDTLLNPAELQLDDAWNNLVEGLPDDAGNEEVWAYLDEASDAVTKAQKALKMAFAAVPKCYTEPDDDDASEIAMNDLRDLLTGDGQLDL